MNGRYAALQNEQKLIIENINRAIILMDQRNASMNDDKGAI